MSPKPWKEYGRYGSIGIELVLSILLGLAAGSWADRRFHTAPWLALLGLVVGGYAGFRQLFLTAKKMSRDIARAEKRERGEDPWEEEARLLAHEAEARAQREAWDAEEKVRVDAEAADAAKPGGDGPDR